MIDITNRAYHDKYQHIFTSIVPCNIYGPHDNFELTASHVIPGMIHRLYNIINETSDIPPEKRVFTVYGSGKPLRQFIYSLDLAKLTVWTLREYNDITPIILSGELFVFLAKAYMIFEEFTANKFLFVHQIIQWMRRMKCQLNMLPEL